METLPVPEKGEDASRDALAHKGSVTITIGDTEIPASNVTFDRLIDVSMGDSFVAQNTSATAFSWPVCTEHEIDPDNITELEGEQFGFCKTCSTKIKLPKYRGVNFDKAGMFIGRALTIEDEENVGELLAELTILRRDVEKDLARNERTLQAVKEAQAIAKRRVIAKAKTHIL